MPSQENERAIKSARQDNERAIKSARFAFTRRDLRLGSGVVLFIYVTSHLVNHALGLVSLEVAETGLRIAVGFWHSLPGTLLLYGAAAAHLALAFLAVYERRTLRIPPAEVLRVALGFGIPMLLIGHAVSTRLAFEVYGHAVEYTRVVHNLWSSDNEGRQLALLAPGWLHGCLGLYFAFGHRPAWQRARYALFGLAVLLPVLSGLGFVAMGREIAGLAADPDWVVTRAGVPELAERLTVARTRDTLVLVYLVLLGAVFGAREIRRLIERGRRSTVSIDYPGRSVSVPRGWSVLEASRSFGIPHVSMCGGRARCSTCRVRINAGADQCPEPQADERATLARIGAEPEVRLACQLRPRGDVALLPLVEAESRGPVASSAVTERDLVLLSATLVNRQALLEDHLPQDTLYLLGLYSEAVGGAVRTHGGRLIGAAGESMIAVFGMHVDLRTASRKAIEALAAIELALERLNARLEREWGRMAVVALSLHAGPAAIGSIGGGDAPAWAVAGETADVAARLALELCRRMRDPKNPRTDRPGIAISNAVLDAAGVEPVDATEEFNDGVRVFRSVKSLASAVLAPR